MSTPVATDTAFFRNVKMNGFQFMLASRNEARFHSVRNAVVIGKAHARGIPARMPCLLDHGLIPIDTTIVMIDLTLSTWGGAAKAAGNTSLFHSPVAQDFWSLVAHVDVFGEKALASWRGSETVARYKAAAAWWGMHRPDWSGTGEMMVTSTVMILVRVLSVLLFDEAGLIAYANQLGSADISSLRQEWQALMGKIGQKTPSDTFIIEDEQGAKSGTAIFRRMK